jgi:molybdopterin synthase sulfur carrier subunit
MSTFSLKFFARLREETGTEQLDIPLSQVSCLSELNDYLIVTYPQWATFLDAKLLTALNQSMVTGDATLNAGDEVALFPPVTGG